MNPIRTLFTLGCLLICTLSSRAQEVPRDLEIHINTYQFDPLQQMIALPDSLKVAQAPGDEDSLYQIIQFNRPLTREDMSLLKDEHGLKLDHYIPNYAYLEHVARNQLADVQALSLFRWSGSYEPAFKVSDRIGRDTFVTTERQSISSTILVVVLHRGVSTALIQQQLSGMGVEVLNIFAHRGDSGSPRLRVQVNNPDDAYKIATIKGVLWIEEEADITTDDGANDNGGVQAWIQSNNALLTPIYNNGIRGEGQIVGLIDMTLDLNHCFFNDPVNANAGPGHRKVVGYRQDNAATLNTGGTVNCSGVNAGTYNRLDHGHGTHTAGTIAGFNTGNANNGIAFNARLTYGDLNDITFSSGGGTRSFLEYLDSARNDGAFIHSNSWSDKAAAAQNTYTTLSQDLDNFTWDNEDHLVVVSSGNNIDTNSDGINDSPSPIRPPFSSKNGLSVAAGVEGNINNVSTGAVGPTFDNRIKPDIYAPGSNTTSALGGSNCGNLGCSGSSMATPAIAGAAALVRQYYMDGWYPSGTQQPHHGFTPSGALIKATLLNSCRNMTGNDAFGQAAPLNGYPSNLEGWGGLVLDDALYFSGDNRNLWVWDVRHSGGLNTGEQHTYSINVLTNTQPVEITLNWTEPPAAPANFASPVINDLNLRVTDPNGTVYLGNDFTNAVSTVNGTTTDNVNNVEMVVVNNPAVGIWQIQVIGTAVNQGNPSQGYALVATTDTQDPPAPTGAQNTLVVLTSVPGTNPAGAPGQPTAQNLMNNLNTYISEVSYDETTINPTYANVTLTTPLGTYLGTDHNLLIEMSQDVITQLVTANPNVFDQGTVATNDDIDRMIILLNDNSFTGDWATTGSWPYDLPSGLTRRISVSVSSVFNDPDRRIAHAMCHQLGLVDLYNHPGVVFAQPHVDNWDIMANLGEMQPMAWSKERANWMSTDHPSSIRWIPRPAAGASFNQTIPLNWLSSIDSANPRAIAIGLTPGAANLADENVFYFIECRTDTAETFDDNIPEEGVLLYYVNENIRQGEGPVRIIDQDLTTPLSLDDAAFGTGAIPPPAGTGLNVTVQAATGSEAYRIQIAYDPPETDNDVNIRVGSPHWTSPDIWVDSQQDGYDQENGRSLADRGNDPVQGEDNRIYFRVWNPGPGDAFDVTVSVRVSEPYHTVGGEADFNRFVNQKFYPRIKAGQDTIDYVVWRPDEDVGPHSCLRVEIFEVVNDVNDYNNTAQQNVNTVESTSASPYEIVVYNFSVTNPYDHDQLFYFRVDGMPAGWTYAFGHPKRLLSANQRYEGNLTIQPPDDAEVCTDHRIDITSWMPNGNTLIQYGGATLNVSLRDRTTLTANTTMQRCDKADVTTTRSRLYVQKPPSCIELTTSGCTNPVRANEEITIRYEDPDGNPVYRVVTTDALGCYSDTYVVTDGGEWTITAIYEGRECSGGTKTEERPIAVPIPPKGRDPKLWYSFHVGSTHPVGDLNDLADANIYAMIDVTYRILDRTNLQLLLGFAQTTAEISSGIDHQHWLHISANAQQIFPTASTMKPYIRLGPGIYRDKGGTTNPGANLGIGGIAQILSELYITPGIDLHWTSFGKDENMSFLTAHLGIVFK